MAFPRSVCIRSLRVLGLFCIALMGVYSWAQLPAIALPREQSFDGYATTEAVAHSIRRLLE